MKLNAILEFIELNPQILVVIENNQIMRATKVNDILSVLSDFDSWLREEYKYRGNEAADPIRQKLHEFMADHSVDLDTL